MSFFTQASFVMDPNVYGVGKLYVPKPTDGSGDLTFTRASNGTRVNQDGLIEKVRQNVLLYSNDFSNAAWSNSNVTLTSGQEDPFGGTTGWRYLMTVISNSYIYQNNKTISGAEMTLSFWVKSNTGSNQSFQATANSGAQASPSFTATTSWQRFSWTFTSSAGNNNILLAYNPVFNCDLLIYGAQFETGVMTDYIPTTSAAVSVGPLANIPRLNYGADGCPSLLLEPQRTNLVTYSEQLNQWNGSNVTITANTSQSPDGYQNADNVNITATNGYWRRSPLTFASSTSYAASVFVKKSATTGTKTFKFYYNNNSLAPNNGEWKCVVDLTNINATTTTAGTAVTGKPTILSTKLVDYGNDWYRVEVAFTTGSGAGNSLSEIGFEANGVVVDFDAYGAQLEAASYASSYIPTLSSAVTRVADGSGTSDTFGTTYTLDADFGLYWEGVINGNTAYPVFYSGGNYAAGADFRSYFVYTGAALQLFGVGEVLTAQITIALTAGTNYKILVKRVGSTIKWYVNGTEYANISGFTTTTVKIRSLFGTTLGAPNHESVKQALIFQTTISDADAIALTA